MYRKYKHVINIRKLVYENRLMYGVNLVASNVIILVTLYASYNHNIVILIFTSFFHFTSL